MVCFISFHFFKRKDQKEAAELCPELDLLLLVRKPLLVHLSSIAQDWHNREQIPSYCFSFFPTTTSTGRYLQFPPLPPTPSQRRLFSLTFCTSPFPSFPPSSFPRVLPPKQIPALSLSLPSRRARTKKTISSRQTANRGQFRRFVDNDDDDDDERKIFRRRRRRWSEKLNGTKSWKDVSKCDTI